MNADCVELMNNFHLSLPFSNSVLVERMCRRTDRSKAFVTNHIRDVVYLSDLEQAMRISLSMWGRQYDYYRSRRDRREDAEKERRLGTQLCKF